MKRKVSLDVGIGAARGGESPLEATQEVLDLCFATGVVFHEVSLGGPLPDLICGFIVVESPDERAGFGVRRASAGEEPDVEVGALEHLPELAGRWLPCPYQLSSLHAVQVFLEAGDRPGEVRVLLAIDTSEEAGSAGRSLDASADAGRPFRPLDAAELGAFLDHPVTRGQMRELGRLGVERAPFKLAAILEALAPRLPRLRFSTLATQPTVPVSLVLDLGNSRSSAILVETHPGGVSSLPLQMRETASPFKTSDDVFGSRLTFLPGPFDEQERALAIGGGFALPSIARLGREALDRALEAPHRFPCSISGPKRYLWDDAPTLERWCFAKAKGDEPRPVAGRLLKHLFDLGDGTRLRDDGPSTPADPRYAPRSMMLFALVEILQQAYAQINDTAYRSFQGREAMPRVLSHLVLTYPSAMRPEEVAVYEALVRHAVVLTCHYLGVRAEDRPNYDPKRNAFEPFLAMDEALAAQMVYVYQEIVHGFGGSMAELVRLYSQDGEKLRIASVDIGGGTSDVMIAEYEDRMPGVGAALHVETLFQDGISIAGDDVCRAIVEDVILEQMLQQLPSARAKAKLAQLLEEGDAGYGAEWRALKTKLVSYFWLPLARCYWAVAEGFSIPDHAPDRHYGTADVWRIFERPLPSSAVLAEIDAFLGREVKGWPGLGNFFFRFDGREVDEAIERVLREPLRKYADILAQFDVDLLVLAGRTSKLKVVRELFVREMPVSPPRIKTMGDYRVGDWYPSRWRAGATIADPKTTVAAGAAVLHLARQNQLPGLVLEGLETREQPPIYGLYQDTEPHVARVTELFRDGQPSPPFLYTRGMRVGFRNVDSEEMDGAPLFEVLPASPDVERALLDDRVMLRFALGERGDVVIAEAEAQRGTRAFTPADFRLRLKTVTVDRYWLDTGVLKVHLHGHGDDASAEEARA